LPHIPFTLGCNAAAAYLILHMLRNLLCKLSCNFVASCHCTNYTLERVRVQKFVHVLPGPAADSRSRPMTPRYRHRSATDKAPMQPLAGGDRKLRIEYSRYPKFCRAPLVRATVAASRGPEPGSPLHTVARPPQSILSLARTWSPGLFIGSCLDFSVHHLGLPSFMPVHTRTL
jgi:hypothetical protein